jgi:hypothetical protein
MGVIPTPIDPLISSLPCWNTYRYAVHCIFKSTNVGFKY